MSKSTHAKKVQEAPAPARRQSRIPVDAIKEALTGHEVLVEDLASKLKIPAMDVRHGIDKLRRGGTEVKRVAMRTFSIPLLHRSR